jgi:hypothetical protein
MSGIGAKAPSDTLPGKACSQSPPIPAARRIILWMIKGFDAPLPWPRNSEG